MDFKKIIFWVVLLSGSSSMPMGKNKLSSWEQAVAHQNAHNHLARIISHLSPVLTPPSQQPEECISKETSEGAPALSYELRKMLAALSSQRRVSRPV